MPDGYESADLYEQDRLDSRRNIGRAAQFIMAAIIVTGLYLGREILIPVALAVFLSFILSPLVRQLRLWRLGRVPSVLIVVAAAFFLLASLTGFVGHQLSQLADNLPLYEQTIRSKIISLKDMATTGGIVERVSNTLSDLSKELARPPAPHLPTPSADASAPTAAPLLVEVQQKSMTPAEALRAVMDPALNSLAMTGLVFVFVIFILLQREDIRDRLIRLTGLHDLNRSTAAIDDAAGRLSRLFLIQTIINVSFGIVITIGLWFIGLPSPALWGILAALLRYVPYVGALISAAFPLALAAAVDPGWHMVLWTALLFAVTEPLVGQGVEPLLHGQSTGLSPIAIVVSATFWTWLWGPVGLILSTPLTVCLTSLGRHVDGLAFFDVLFGATPPLSPPQKFYLRMLANDPAEAAAEAEAYLKEHTLLEYYDDVAMQGIGLATLDLRRGKLALERLPVIHEATLELIDDLTADMEKERKRREARSTDQSQDSKDPGRREDGELIDGEVKAVARITAHSRHSDDLDAHVLCVPGRNVLDDSASVMLAQLLAERGIAVTSDASALSQGPPALICISYFGAKFSPTHARFLIRRIRRQYPGVPVLAGYWTVDENGVQRSPSAAAEADFSAISLAEAVDICVSNLSSDAPAKAAL
ncbi:AI-2E family transporter [Roseiarcaceae bacterium H3SJ34-1]|uniref:AI-2E family transporter n=1 Tax=Terripilifer ovatus TaxID=3032367 RepID=UPI003AB959B8|nr:AI-2E family transporter [Roseiarcaceae bacterium H3SJ34-1]